jgi:RecJ-like exonuclease
MAYDLFDLVKKAANIILNTPKSSKIRVISHYDTDGVTAAAIICKALHRAGYDFHATLMRNPFTKGFIRLKEEENNLIIFSDMGSGQIETIESIGNKAIILDHHQYLKDETTKNVFQINANLCNINGNYEACGSSLAYSLAQAISENNKDLVDLAAIGIAGDKQYIGGIRGYNKSVINDGIKNGYLSKSISIKLTEENIKDSLFYSIDPYYSGYSGCLDKINCLIKKLNISGKEKYKDLDEKIKKKIHSSLMLKLIEKGCEKNILDTIIRERYLSSMFNCETERFSDLVDACGKGGNRGLALSVCLGDKKSLHDAFKLEKNYKKNILDELLRLEKDGVEETKSYRYFYSKNSSLGGVVGGISTNFILDKMKPLISMVRKNNEIHISCRGNQYLVSKGLDLGSAMKEVANKLNGHGGGHKIAAGATISSDKEVDFIRNVELIISKQMGL